LCYILKNGPVTAFQL